MMVETEELEDVLENIEATRFVAAMALILLFTVTFSLLK